MEKLTTLIFGLIFLITGLVSAQDMAIIQGKIIDEKNMQAVPYANVSLFLQRDSLLVIATVTNDKGEFNLSGIKPDTYYMRVNNMGYQNTKIDKIDLAGKSNLDVGSIILSPSEITLNEVNVVGDKLKGQEKVDRTIYALTSTIKEVSKSGLDVLRYIPAVSVDLQENVSLEGRTDIVFYVDGIQRDKDFVSQIDPGKIERVEVMTNPSSKYGADVSGVIQIILSKEKLYGINGRISVDIPSPPTYIMSPGASLDYGYSNMRFYISDRMHLEKFNGFQETNTIRSISGNSYQQMNIGTGNFSMMNNNINYGMDWFINEENTLNYFGDFSYNDFNFNDFKFDNYQMVNDVLTDKQMINQDLKSRGKSGYYSLFYKRNFAGTDKELSAQASFYDYSGNDYQLYNHYIQDISTDEIIDEYTREVIINNKRKSFDLITDYTQNLKNSSLEAGAKAYYQWFDNVQSFGSDADSNFLYDELRLASYLNYSYKFEKLSIQGGLRAEWSETVINSDATNNYFSLLPQFSLIRQFKKSQNVKLNFRRRIYRPGIDELNPFEVWTDSLHMRKGNPNLQPAYSNDAELVYSKNFNSSMVSPKVYAKFKTGDFQDISFINDMGVIESRPENIGKSWEYGFALNFALKLNKWWMINGYGKVYKSIIYNNDNADDLNQEKISYQTNLTSIMTLFKTWNLMLMMNYRSPYITYQQTHYRDPMLIMGLEKEIFKNGKLQIMYLPPYTNKFTFEKYETQTPELFNSWKGGVNFDYLFAIQFTWSFKSGKKVKELERPTDFDSDTNKSIF